MPNSGNDDINSLLPTVSQQFEGVLGDTEVDELFLQASQSYELMASEEPPRAVSKHSPQHSVTMGMGRER